MTEHTKESAIAQIKKLEGLVTNLESTSKLLVKRDLDLRRAYDSLKSLDLEKTEFVSIAAHQLRTPVTSARWAISYLQEKSDGLSEQQQTLLKSAKQSVDHVYDLVENLLELNRLDFGNINLTLVPSSLESLCEEVITSQQQIKEHTHIEIMRNYATHPRPVPFDQHRLRDVVDNLVDNAIKYSGDSTKIVVATSYSDNSASVSVTDFGIGVHQDEANKIFQKFTRLGNAEKIDPNGTGLGLYISKSIAQKHGGELTYTPNDPTGSVFTVTLPC